MLEYPDNSFGEIVECNEALKKLHDLFEVNQPVKAIHFGTVEELQAKKKEKTLAEKIKCLEKRVKKLEPIVTNNIIQPTSQDIINFGAIFTK